MNAEVRKARKRSVEIDYMVWPGGAQNATPVIDWVLREGGTARYHEEVTLPGKTSEDDRVISELIAIDTLEGTMVASAGDAIIRGVAGEFYPCRGDIFRDTYAIVSAEHHEDAEDRLVAVANLIADAAVSELSGVTGILRGESMTWTDQGVHAAVWTAVRHNEKIHQAIGMSS